MTKYELFAQFFTNLLKLENRQEAREIAKIMWPQTSNLWIYRMDIDPVLIELGLAEVSDDGRIRYVVPVDMGGWTNYEIELEVGDPRNPVLNLMDGSKTSWSLIKPIAKRETVKFEVAGSSCGITFYLGPDIFENSYRLAWMTPEEKEDPENKFQDNRVRSSNPDDFLSRIRHLAWGSGPFVPQW